MVKERMGPLACVLRETAAKTWQRSFALFIAVKHCGTFIANKATELRSEVDSAADYKKTQILRNPLKICIFDHIWV